MTIVEVDRRRYSLRLPGDRATLDDIVALRDGAERIIADLTASIAEGQAPGPTVEEIRARLVARHDRKRRKARGHQGRYVIGSTPRGEAICALFDGVTFGQVDGEMLRIMYREARDAGFTGPIHVHASTSLIGETQTFRFYQEVDR